MVVEVGGAVGVIDVTVTIPVITIAMIAVVVSRVVVRGALAVEIVGPHSLIRRLDFTLEPAQSMAL